MPINYKEYPENWKWLSRQVIADAGNKCELCYAPNHEYIVRLDKKHTHPWGPIKERILLTGEKPVKIILTVHHIDGDKQNSKKQNLIALCQRCHLRLDLLKHMRNRKRSHTKVFL